MQTDDPVHFPCLAFLFPQGDKPAGFGNGVGFHAVVEFVQADLNGPKPLYFVYFNAAWHQLPGHFAADIRLDALQDIRLGGAQPPLVVVEFKVVTEQPGLGFHITGIVGREIGIIQGKHRFV